MRYEFSALPFFTKYKLPHGRLCDVELGSETVHGESKPGRDSKRCSHMFSDAYTFARIAKTSSGEWCWQVLATSVTGYIPPSTFEGGADEWKYGDVAGFDRNVGALYFRADAWKRLGMLFRPAAVSRNNCVIAALSCDLPANRAKPPLLELFGCGRCESRRAA